LHLYPIQIELEKVNKSHAQIFEELRANGIGVNLHYIPVHTQPFYQNMGFQIGDFPVAENYYSRAISIPLFHSMTLEQQDEVVRVLREVLV
jgi:dTDP-4-amino-4,6-dideoxygalactose transaminase